MLSHRLVGPQLSPGPASLESTISCSQMLLICALGEVQVVERARRAPLLVGHHQRERDVLVGVGGARPCRRRHPVGGDRPVHQPVAVAGAPASTATGRRTASDRLSCPCRRRSTCRRRSPPTPSTSRACTVDGVGRRALDAAHPGAGAHHRVGLPLRVGGRHVRVQVAGRIGAARVLAVLREREVHAVRRRRRAARRCRAARAAAPARAAALPAVPVPATPPARAGGSRRARRRAAGSSDAPATTTGACRRDTARAGGPAARRRRSRLRFRAAAAGAAAGPGRATAGGAGGSAQGTPRRSAARKQRRAGECDDKGGAMRSESRVTH